jgi:hypothetical protein
MKQKGALGTDHQGDRKSKKEWKREMRNRFFGLVKIYKWEIQQESNQSVINVL